MTLAECKAAHTNREFQLWELWYEQQWNKPSRTDNYLMALTEEVRRFRYMFLKNPPPINDSDFKLTFTRQTVEQKVQLSLQEKAARSKAIWIGAVTGAKRKPQEPTNNVSRDRGRPAPRQARRRRR